MCIHEFLDLAALDLVLLQEVGGILLLIGFQSLYFRKAVFLVEQTLQDRDFIHHVWISAVLQRIDKISILLAYQVERAAFHQRSIVVALIVYGKMTALMHIQSAISRSPKQKSLQKHASAQLHGFSPVHAA